MSKLGSAQTTAAGPTALEHCERSAINTTAEATIEVWQHVGARLAPIIGARGVDVLFSHALQRTAAFFPWLVMSAQYESSEALFPILKMRLASQEAAIALEANLALRLAFTELLASLIGHSLTQRLLGPVWTIAVTGI